MSTILDGLSLCGCAVMISCALVILGLLMAAVPIVSWNIRGLQNPLKWTMVSTALWRHLPAICALQETHLTEDTLSCLNFAWLGWAFHSTHTSFSRGVSVLIHRTLDFQVFDKLMDTEGRYVFLMCHIFKLKCILAFVYVPPLFNPEVLRTLLTYHCTVWETLVAILIQAWTNHPPPPPPRLTGGGTHCMALLKFIEEVGWVDP